MNFLRKTVSLLCILSIVLSIGCVNENDVYVSSEHSSQTAFVPEGSSLSVVFIDVGQGDSELIVCDGEALLIDGGENEYSASVLNTLYSYGITKLDYLVATHPHADHIGGLRKVINNFAVEHLLMPDVTNNTSSYEKLIEAIEKNDLAVEVPKVGDTFNVGSAVCTVLAPQDHYYEDLNDYSIVICLEYAGRKILFSADCAAASQSDMMTACADMTVDVYKVSHHGSSEENSVEWINKIRPAYAVISCDGESYNHPHPETVSRLSEIGTVIYRTDRDGSVTLTVDSKGNITFETKY